MGKGSEGWQVSSLCLKEMPLAMWRPRRRGGHLSPPMKLHGKNISKCISKTVP